MPQFFLVFCLSHLLCSWAFGAITQWRESGGGIVGGGLGILAIYAAIFAATRLGARDRRWPLPQPSAIRVMVGCSLYLVAYDAACVLFRQVLSTLHPTFPYILHGWLSPLVSVGVFVLFFRAELKREASAVRVV